MHKQLRNPRDVLRLVCVENSAFVERRPQTGQHLAQFRSSIGARWWARRDSNPQPDGYEPSALTVELQARSGNARGRPPIPRFARKVIRDYTQISGMRFLLMRQFYRPIPAGSIRSENIVIPTRQHTSPSRLVDIAPHPNRSRLRAADPQVQQQQRDRRDPPLR
jgi:hypothetical protein